MLPSFLLGDYVLGSRGGGAQGPRVSDKSKEELLDHGCGLD
jgi:hypothetical protein